jgi:hypothetical protein
MVLRAAHDVDGQARRLWVRFTSGRVGVHGRLGGGALADILAYGCGVTGVDEDDCWRRVRAVFGDRPLPECSEVVFDVDVSTLDPVHVVPGIGNPGQLGVWFLSSAT